MYLDPVDERVLLDRARVRGAVAQGLAVGLAGSPDVRLGDRRERDELDGVDLDQAGADPVAAALLDLGPPPQPDRQRDIAGQDVIAQLTAELHTPDANRSRAARHPRASASAFRRTWTRIGARAPASPVLPFGRIAALLGDHALLAPLLNETILVRDDALAVCPALFLIRARRYSR